MADVLRDFLPKAVSKSIFLAYLTATLAWSGHFLLLFCITKTSHSHSQCHDSFIPTIPVGFSHFAHETHIWLPYTRRGFPLCGFGLPAHFLRPPIQLS